MTGCEQMLFCFSSFVEGFSYPFDGLNLGSLLLLFLYFFASVVLILLLRGAMFLLHVEDDFARMLIGILGTGDRTLQHCSKQPESVEE